MDFGLSFSYVFKDTDWFKKILIISLITLIPLIGSFVLIGWLMEISRRVATGDRNPLLPDLDFGKQLGDGFKAFVAFAIYSLPIFVIYLPLIIISAIAGATGMDADTTAAILGILSACTVILVILYSLFLAFVTPAIYTRIAIEGSIGAGLKVREIFSIVKSAFGSFLLCIVGSILAGAIIAPLGSIACGIGALLTTAYAMAVMGHLYGQAYAQATLNKATPPTPISYENLPPAL
jgi:hypothetical protein